MFLTLVSKNLSFLSVFAWKLSTSLVYLLHQVTNIALLSEYDLRVKIFSTKYRNQVISYKFYNIFVVPISPEKINQFSCPEKQLPNNFSFSTKGNCKLSLHPLPDRLRLYCEIDKIVTLLRGVIIIMSVVWSWWCSHSQIFSSYSTQYLGHKHQYITAYHAHVLLRLSLTGKCVSFSVLFWWKIIQWTAIFSISCLPSFKAIPSVLSFLYKSAQSYW